MLDDNDIQYYLKQQKDNIRKMMLETNQVMRDYKAEPYDFLILDQKMMGRVELLRALPYTVYVGKVRVKGNETPMRIELLNDKMAIQFAFCYDDPTFTKTTVFTLNNQTDRLQHYQQSTAEFCYFRVIYESQDLTGQSVVFRIYFGQPQSILASYAPKASGGQAIVPGSEPHAPQMSTKR